MLEGHAPPCIIVARMSNALKGRISSAALVWRDLGKDCAVSSFTLKLHGWSDTRRFVVVRELEREDKSAVGRRLIDVPGHTFRVWVTNRTEDAATLWRDYNGRATSASRNSKTTCTPADFARASSSPPEPRCSPPSSRITCWPPIRRR